MNRPGCSRIGVVVSHLLLSCVCAATLELRLQAQELEAGKPVVQQNRSESLCCVTRPNANPSLTMGSLTGGERIRIYSESTFGPQTLVGPAVGAAMTEWITGNPPEWGQGLKGYGRRFASGYARNVVTNTIAFGVAFADGEDPRPVRSHQSRVWPRVRFAIVQTLVSRTESGSRIPAFSRFAGLYGAAFVSNAWYPARTANTGQALYRGSTALAWSVASHVFYEFQPEIKKLLHLR